MGRCGECRLGLGVHDTTDPLCDHHPKGKHMGEWPRCATCGAPENAHPFRHPFKVAGPGGRGA